MSTSPPRRRSPLADDLFILLMGTWGFLLQCLGSWKKRDESRDDT